MLWAVNRDVIERRCIMVQRVIQSLPICNTMPHTRGIRE